MQLGHAPNQTVRLTAAVISALGATLGLYLFVVNTIPALLLQQWSMASRYGLWLALGIGLVWLSCVGYGRFALGATWLRAVIAASIAQLLVVPLLWLLLRPIAATVVNTTASSFFPLTFEFASGALLLVVGLVLHLVFQPASWRRLLIVGVLGLGGLVIAETIIQFLPLPLLAWRSWLYAPLLWSFLSWLVPPQPSVR